MISQIKHQYQAASREVFHLIIQTSVTPFLVFIPVTLIFFLFIKFFSFQKYSCHNVCCILQVSAQQSIMVLQCWASPHNFLSSPPSAPMWWLPKNDKDTMQSFCFIFQQFIDNWPGWIRTHIPLFTTISYWLSSIFVNVKILKHPHCTQYLK